MISSLLHAFFPEVCMVCKRLLYEKEQHICLHCLYRLPQTDYLSLRENELYRKLANRVPLQSAQAMFFFHKKNESQKLLHAIKYDTRPHRAFWFGKLMGQAWSGSGRPLPEVLVPVPLHPRRLKERGYNQSEALAAGLLSSFGTSVLQSSVLSREGYKNSQTEKGRADRWKDAVSVYALGRQAECVKAKSVLLIDDVITTGSTIEACAELLWQLDIAELHVYSLSMAVG